MFQVAQVVFSCPRALGTRVPQRLKKVELVRSRGIYCQYYTLLRGLQDSGGSMVHTIDMEYSRTFPGASPGVSSMFGEQQQPQRGQGQMPAKEVVQEAGEDKAKNVEELLEYLARNQSMLSNDAFEQLMSVLREKPVSVGRSDMQEKGFHAGQIPEPVAAATVDPLSASLQHGYMQHNNDQSASMFGGTRGNGLKQTALLECPKSMVGRVIGKAGETIKALQQYTGAMIQIDQSTDPTRVTIAGSPQALQLAISMVSDIIKGKFKGFAMLRQIATANEVAQQHGGMGAMAAQPVYVQGYGFMPPSQSGVASGYTGVRGGLGRDVNDHAALLTMASLSQQQSHVHLQPNNMHQQRQYLVSHGATSTNNTDHNAILTKLMQLAAMEQREHMPQQGPSQPENGSFLFNTGMDHQTPFDPFGSGSNQIPGQFGNYGVFNHSGMTKGDDPAAFTTKSMF